MQQFSFNRILLHKRKQTTRLNLQLFPDKGLHYHTKQKTKEIPMSLAPCSCGHPTNKDHKEMRLNSKMRWEVKNCITNSWQSNFKVIDFIINYSYALTCKHRQTNMFHWLDSAKYYYSTMSQCSFKRDRNFLYRIFHFRYHRSMWSTNISSEPLLNQLGHLRKRQQCGII